MTTVTWVQDSNSNYEISSKDHLVQLMNNGTLYTNAGSVPSTFDSMNYIQTVDIDLLGDSTNIVPIGNLTSGWRGVYDGNGFSILNWVYTDTDFPNAATSNVSNQVGLFGSIWTGTIKNVRMAGVCTLSGFRQNAGFIAGRPHTNAKLFNLELDLSPGSYIVQSSAETFQPVCVGTVIGTINQIQVGGLVVGITFRGEIDNITPSSSSTVTNVGGVAGEIDDCDSVDVTLFRNLGIFPNGLNGTHVGGIIGYVHRGPFTKGLNAMTGDINGTTSAGGVVGYFRHYPSSTTPSDGREFINSMRGNITAASHAGGVIGWISEVSSNGATLDTYMNYMGGDITSTGGSPGGIFGNGGSSTSTFSETTINAMNGDVSNAISPSGQVATIDTSFGLTFTNIGNSTTNPLTGFSTDPDNGLPVIDLTVTDPDGVVLTFSFVFGNAPVLYNKLTIETSDDNLSFTELEVLLMNGTNIALLGTASGGLSASLGNDSNLTNFVDIDITDNPSTGVSTSTTDYVYSSNTTGGQFGPGYTFMSSGGTVGKIVTFPTTLTGVTSIDFTTMTGAILRNTTANFDGAQVTIRALDESDQEVGSVSSPSIPSSTILSITQMPVMSLSSANVKTLEFIGSGSGGANFTFGIADVDAEFYRITQNIDTYDPITWTLDFDKGYVSSDINRVIFRGYDNGLGAPVTGSISLISSGGFTIEVGTLTTDLVQEFIVSPSPEFLILTPKVTTIDATISEVPGSVGYSIAINESGSSRVNVPHSGVPVGNFVIRNLKPETTYDLVLYADNVATDWETVVTLQSSPANYNKNDFVGSSATYDLTTLGTNDWSSINTVINDVFATGDDIEVKLAAKNKRLKFVRFGETISTEDSILVPFDTSSGGGQEITIELSDTSSTIVSYDENNNSLSVDGATVNVGESIKVDGKKMTVVDI